LSEQTTKNYLISNISEKIIQNRIISSQLNAFNALYLEKLKSRIDNRQGQKKVSKEWQPSPLSRFCTDELGQT
jgi:hypothetical protein